MKKIVFLTSILLTAGLGIAAVNTGTVTSRSSSVLSKGTVLDPFLMQVVPVGSTGRSDGNVLNPDGGLPSEFGPIRPGPFTPPPRSPYVPPPR